jgi:hypothetical protein
MTAQLHCDLEVQQVVQHFDDTREDSCDTYNRNNLTNMPTQF